MALDVLAFAAHRDDNEITCGGLLIRMAEKGYKVGACDLTQGEMGTLGSAPERQAECEEATKAMGLAARINCELPDSGVFNTREYQSRVVEVLREQRPKVVVLPGLEQRHPDHRITPQLVFDACFFAGLEKFGKGKKHRPTKILWCHMPQFDERRPSFVVDITAQMDKKIAAVMAYKTQFPDKDKMVEWLRARARTYGMMIGTPYGEGYTQREVMQVDDVVTLPGVSI
ncbi:MAG TPA: bacillithiol biosynthesis deacetylase BshB1 [Planctomycetota bacterium]|nr:bacillithiol biosynthesis deacetylase BshB1 [Planctomycetota bacterium]